MQIIRHSCAILSNNNRKKFVCPAYSSNASSKRIKCIDKDKTKYKFTLCTVVIHIQYTYI